MNEGLVDMDRNAPLTLYYHPGATSFAVHVVLRELGLPFDLIRVDLNQDEQRADWFLKVNPRGRVPALKIGEGVLTETPAILTSLVQAHPDSKLFPEAGSPEAARALEWLSWLASSVHIAFAQVFFPARFSTNPESTPALEKAAHAGLAVHFDDINEKLGAPWALGERFSVVDPYLFVFCRFAKLIHLDASPGHRRLYDWRARMMTRKSVIDAMNLEEITADGRI